MYAGEGGCGWPGETVGICTVLRSVLEVISTIHIGEIDHKCLGVGISN